MKDEKKLPESFQVSLGEKYPIVFIFLDGDENFALIQSITVPAGIIRRIFIYGNDSETNLETLYVRVRADSQLILPTKWGSDARAYIPVVPNGQEFFFNKPLFEQSKIEVEINVAPTDGCVITIEYEDFPLERRIQKSAVKSKFTAKMELSK